METQELMELGEIARAASLIGVTTAIVAALLAAVTLMAPAARRNRDADEGRRRMGATCEEYPSQM